MSRNSIVGLCPPGQWIGGCISSRAGGGSPKGPSTPSRCPLVRDPPPLMSAWRRSPIRSGPLSRPLSTFPLPQAGGESLGTKVSLCFGPSPSFRQYFQFFLSWAESQQPGMGWSQRGYHSFAPALPPPAPSPFSPVWNERAQQPGLPFSLQARPLSQWVALQT